MLSRRYAVLGGLGLIGAGALSACTGATPTSVGVGAGRALGPVPSASPSAGQKLVSASLTPKPTTLDLAGTTVNTWAYGDSVPGQLIRATAGDFLRVTVDNRLPADTTVHWHGIRLRNAADGVPGVTQDPIKPGAKYVYEFTAPDPGTYFFHPHVGVQLDRGLYAPLIIDDPAEPGKYDDEWVIVLDDWIDGTGTNPDEVLNKLIADGGSGSGGMGDMGHMGGSMGMGVAPWGDAGDVTYPYFLINGKAPKDPATFSGKPGQKIRMRVINAASDTIFTLALGGHRMTITHTDGHPVQPTEVGAFYLGMGERYDVTVTLDDGVFPLVAAPFGKEGQAALAVVRTGSGTSPVAGVDAVRGRRLRLHRVPAAAHRRLATGGSGARRDRQPDPERVHGALRLGDERGTVREEHPAHRKGGHQVADQRQQHDDDDAPPPPARAGLRACRQRAAQRHRAPRPDGVAFARPRPRCRGLDGALPQHLSRRGGDDDPALSDSLSDQCGRARG